MKRKIVNGILLMALVVSSVSSFVSCKDYDEDLRTSLEGKLNNESTLREALEAQLLTLKATVNDLQNQLNNLEGCKCDLSEYIKRGELADYATKEQWNALLGRIAAIETAKTLMEERIAAIENLLNTLDSRVTTLEQKIILLDTEIAAAKASAAEALQKAQDALAKANEALEKQQTPYDDTILKGMITNLTEVVNTLTTTVANLEARVIAVEGVAADALAKAQAAQATANANYLTIESLKAQIETINKWIENHGASEGGYDETKLLLLIKDLTERIEMIETSYCTKCDLEEAMELAQKANDAIASIRDSIARGDIVTLGQLKDSLNKYVTKVEFYDSIKWIRDSIDNFSKRIAVLEDTVSALTADFRKMITGIIVQGTQSPVLGYLNTPFDARATVLAVYYGTPNAKWEFPSTSASNYVNGSSDFNKWTSRNIQIIGALTSISGYESGNSGTNLVSLKDGAEEGNAGTIYVTVNPSNVDFTGQELKLKDSQDGDAYATLSPLKASDRLLTFGYTRADNGFYEADATIKAADVENAALKVDYQALEEDAKAIWNEHSKSSVLEMGSSLVKLFQDMIPAYAVMGSWTDQLDGKEHKIYSQYNVAATAIKPLSFSFMNGASISKMPGFEKVQDMVGELIDKINIKVDLGLPDFSKYKGSITFTNLTLPTIGDDMFRFTYKKTWTAKDLAGSGKLYGDVSDVDLFFLVTNVADGKYALISKDSDGNNVLWIKDGDTWRVATKDEMTTFGAISFDLTVDVDINKTPEIKSTLQDIIDSLNDQYGSGSSLAKNITDLLNDVASLSNIDSNISASIEDAKTDIKSQINSYITRANNKLTKWFNRLPGFLHLALVGGKDHNIGLLSQSKKMATQASGSLKLVPTTYSLELLAPAYKKLVVVSDVFNADGTPVAVGTAKSMAASANGENMGKVIDSDKTCTLNAGKSGYIYEITYTAMDYFGKVAIKKYYVKF